jgi:hypothetical protein
MSDERSVFDAETAPVLAREEITAPALAGDSIIAIAQGAERRIEAVKKIRSLALRVTGANDWVDQDGKPYLQVSGAEKVARLFGISWRVGEPEQRVEDDGHFRYVYKGEFMMSGVSIEAIGTRSSKDPFFGRRHGEDVPPEQVDKANVMKSAYTNCIGNGITRLLGLRNMTWDDLRASGVEQKAAGRVERKSAAPATEDDKKLQAELWDMLMDQAEGNKTAAKNALAQVTAFTGRDGTQVSGVTDVSHLKGTRLQIAHNKTKKGQGK